MANIKKKVVNVDVEKDSHKKGLVPLIFLCIGLPIFTVGLLNCIVLPEPYNGFSYQSVSIDDMDVYPNNFVIVNSSEDTPLVLAWQDYTGIEFPNPSMLEEIQPQTNILVLDMEMNPIANTTLYQQGVMKAIPMANGRVLLVTRQIEKNIRQDGKGIIEPNQQETYEIYVLNVKDLGVLPGYPFKPGVEFSARNSEINLTSMQEQDAWHNVYYFYDAFTKRERIFAAFGMDCATYYVNNGSMEKYTHGEFLDQLVSVDYSYLNDLETGQKERTNWVPIEIGKEGYYQQEILRQRSGRMDRGVMGWNTTNMGVFSVLDNMSLTTGGKWGTGIINVTARSTIGKGPQDWDPRKILRVWDPIEFKWPVGDKTLVVSDNLCLQWSATLQEVYEFRREPGSKNWGEYTTLPGDLLYELVIAHYNLTRGNFTGYSNDWGPNAKATSIRLKSGGVWQDANISLLSTENFDQIEEIRSYRPADYNIVPYDSYENKKHAVELRLMTISKETQQKYFRFEQSGTYFIMDVYQIPDLTPNPKTTAGKQLGDFYADPAKGYTQIAFPSFKIPASQLSLEVANNEPEAENPTKNYGPVCAVFNRNESSPEERDGIILFDPDQWHPGVSISGLTEQIARLYQLDYSVLKLTFVPDVSNDNEMDLVVVGNFRGNSTETALFIIHLSVFEPPQAAGFRLIFNFSNKSELVQTTYSILFIGGIVLVVLAFVFGKWLFQLFRSKYKQWKVMLVGAFIVCGAMIALTILYNLAMAEAVGYGVGANNPEFATFQITRFYIMIGVVVILAATPLIGLAIPAAASVAAKRVYIPLHRLVKKSNEKRETQIFTVKQPRDATVIQIVSRVLLCVFLPLSIGLYCYNYLPSLVFPDFQALTTNSTIYDDAFTQNLQALFFLLILPAVGSFFLLGWIIAGGWLLDDTGVVYWIKNLEKREPLDINRLSSFISGFLGSVLGFTAIINYVQFLLESPMLSIIYDSYGDLFLAGLFAVIFFGLPVFTGVIAGLFLVARYENQYYVERKQMIKHLTSIGLNRKFDIEYDQDEGLNTTIKMRLLPEGDQTVEEEVFTATQGGEGYFPSRPDPDLEGSGSPPKPPRDDQPGEPDWNSDKSDEFGF